MLTVNFARFCSVFEKKFKHVKVFVKKTFLLRSKIDLISIDL